MEQNLSIVMTAHNSGKYIWRAVSSILNQSHTDFELIIVNDASQDNTLDIISSIKDKRIRIFDNPTNSGTYYSRNLGLMNAKGEFIAFVDSDDIVSPSRFEKILHFLANQPDIMHVETRYLRFYEDTDNLWFRDWNRGVGFCVIRKQVRSDLGYFLPLRANGDMEYAQRVKKFYGKNKSKVLNDFTYWAIQRPSNLTNTIVGNQRQKFQDYAYQVFHESEELFVPFPFEDKTLNEFRQFELFSANATSDINDVRQIQNLSDELIIQSDLIEESSYLISFLEQSTSEYYNQLLESKAKIRKIKRKHQKESEIYNSLPKALIFVGKIYRRLKN